jgi:hypothetical protein
VLGFEISGWVVRQRLQEEREEIHFVVTATSRAIRPGEVDGKDYHFVTKEEFLTMIEREELLEYALVYGEYKGIPKQQVRYCFTFVILFIPFMISSWHTDVMIFIPKPKLFIVSVNRFDVE